MIYLDNAATTFPKPPAVVRTVSGIMEKLCANPGRSGHRMSLAAGRIVANCRDALAALLNVPDPAHIIFCLNCTDALNMAIRGLLRPGDHVIATALDHNASLRPLAGLQERGVISMTVLSPEKGMDSVTARQVADSFYENTRLVVCAHGSNVTGAVQPAAEIGALCNARGVPFLLDAAQTLGIVPVCPDELGADLVAFPGHKGLYGPTGTGGLWIREGLTLAPYREGGTGSRSESVLQPSDLPDRYESGTLNLVGIAGLLQGVRFVIRHREEIAAHEAEMANYLRDKLRCIKGMTLYGPQDPTLGVVSYNLRGKRSGEVADVLSRHNIGVRSGLHCAPLAHEWLGTLETGTVRVSPGFFNTKSDLDRLVWITERAARG